MAPESFTIGIDLGGSSVKGVAVTPEGETLGQGSTDFDVAEPMEWAEAVKALVDRLQRRRRKTSTARVGLAAPGVAAADGRSIVHMPGRLEGLVGLDWSRFLQNVDPEIRQPVPVLNDAHAALLGELWLGAAKGFQNVILLTLGTGVGGAAMVDGQLLRGHTGKAGHLGHTCLDIDGAPDISGLPGSLEDGIGNATVAERSRGRFSSTHELIVAHQTGDAEATKIWMRSVKALAYSIGSFANVLDPEAVIIGGGIARAGDALFEPLEKMVHDVEWKICGHEVTILPAQLGELAGAYGAAYRALNPG